MGKSEQEQCLRGMTKYISLGGPATCLCPGRVGVATAIGLYLLCSLSIYPRVGDFHKSRFRQEVPSAAEPLVNLRVVLFPTGIFVFDIRWVQPGGGIGDREWPSRCVLQGQCRAGCA